MGIDRILAIVGIATAVAAVSFAGYQYREVHLPEFEELKAVVGYQQCIQQCQSTCTANGVSLNECSCGHCNLRR
jgi:hypothetical protein